MTLHRFTFRAMASENEIQLHCDDPSLAGDAASRAIAEVQRIEAKYSRYRAASVVSRINAQAGAAPVAIDAETRGLLAFAAACHRQSDGAFDATSGVLRRARRFDLDRVPADGELAPLLALIGMELDFGGFGKEYAVDRAALALNKSGVASALVNLAGDLTILGSQPDGSPWRVGIRHPRREDALLASLPVSSGAIATSGDYERFVEVDGVRHCHILDPRSGRSVRSFQSVTVHASSCLIAGSASTIAMLKGEDEGLAWLDELGLSHLCVRANGEVVDRFGQEKS